MPYLSIKEASDLTGKNEKTIRRLIKKPESTSYIKIEEGKLFIDAEYLDKMYNSVHLVSTHPGQSTTTSSSSVEELTTHTRHVHGHPSNQD
ncbi:MAG TPA: hypothetical protein VD794_10940, partial [Flavisolibacter sp.]|nr:hypothetical protein [Flavisolibacter sp.]